MMKFLPKEEKKNMKKKLLEFIMMKIIKLM